WIADAGRLAKKDLVIAHQPQREGIYQRIQSVGIIKRYFATDRGDAKCVAVMRDAGHNSGQERPVPSPILRVIQRSEPQAVKGRDGTCSHREDVAEDSSNAGSRTLKWFDERRMIVRFDLECGAPSVTHVYHACILSRRHNHALACSGETFEMHPRRLIGTMLRPHHREDSEFDQVRLASKQLFDTVEFFDSEIMRN